MVIRHFGLISMTAIQIQFIVNRLMTKRSVPRRNFWGALWGGIFGILAVGYLAPVVLPFGCLLGTLLGWFYREIWRNTSAQFRKEFAPVARTCMYIRTSLLALIRFFKGTRPNVALYRRFLKKVWSILVWIVSCPRIFSRWMQKNPDNQARITTLLAIYTFLGLNALWIVSLTRQGYLFAGLSAGNDFIGSGLYTLWGVEFIGLCLLCFTPIIGLRVERGYGYEHVRGPEIRRKLEDSLQEYVDGPIRFFFASLGFQIFFAVTLVIGFSVLIGWFTVVLLMFTLCVLVPVAVVIGLAKGFYQVFTKAGYWLCLGVTLTATSLIAWIAAPFLEDAILLWAVALIAGLTSAGAVELIRNSLLRLFVANTRVRRAMSVPFMTRLASTWRLFYTMTAVAGEKSFAAVDKTVDFCMLEWFRAPSGR